MNGGTAAVKNKFLFVDPRSLGSTFGCWSAAAATCEKKQTKTCQAWYVRTYNARTNTNSKRMLNKKKKKTKGNIFTNSKTHTRTQIRKKLLHEEKVKREELNSKHAWPRHHAVRKYRERLSINTLSRTVLTFPDRVVYMVHDAAFKPEHKYFWSNSRWSTCITLRV